MINKHEEKEYKMMINKNIYQSLLTKYNLTSYIQNNYYYKTNNPKIAMRTRKIDNKFYFTLKVDKDDYKDEYEFEIKENNLNDSRIQKLLSSFNITNPEYLGMLETKRAVLRMKYGELCLDYNRYLNNEDYEIEYELYNYLKETDEFKLFLKENNLLYEKSKRSKYGRFIDEKSRHLNS